MDADVCIQCGDTRPLDEFYEAGADWGVGGPKCRACRTARSLVPAALDWGKTPTKFRQALTAHLESTPGTPFSQVAREVGLPSHWGLETILAKSADARRVYRQLLRDAGIDLPYLAAKLRIMLHAQKKVWNPAEDVWETFPDNTTQMRAIELAHKLHNQIGGNEKDQAAAPTIVVLTNIGQQDVRAIRRERTYSLDASTGQVQELGEEASP
jgi:hypothetical protein